MEPEPWVNPPRPSRSRCSRSDSVASSLVANVRLMSLREEIDRLDLSLASGDVDMALIVFDPLVSFMTGAELRKEGEVRYRE
jgi:hypothetical protein